MSQAVAVRTKPAAVGEVRSFKMHPKLLFDVIQRQAGTLAKAVLEGVMNSVDAKATKCTITITETTVVIADDGRGFRNRQEILDFFEVFGQPHTEAEGKIFGTFRMGRGQLFAFGANQWKTGIFRMAVDIKNKGLDYTLKTNKDRPGCRVTVELYEPLLPSGLAETARMLQHWLKYAPIEVQFNGEQINIDPAKQKWDYVLDEAYINLKERGSLEVYNLGVHTLTLSDFKYGTGGTIVSRQQLKVNFARNDIQSDCPVWKKVSKVVDQKATERNKRTVTLDDAGRTRLAFQFRHGQMDFFEFVKLKLFTTVSGRQYAFKDLPRAHTMPLTVCKRGDRMGDKLHQQGVAFVLAQETVDRFTDRGDVKKFFEWLNSPELRNAGRFRYVPFKELTAGLKNKFDIFATAELNPRERCWLRLLGNAVHTLRFPDQVKSQSSWKLWKPDDPQERKLVVGLSDAALAWTDGATYIAFDRKFLAKYELDVHGFVAVGQVLLHELCHGEADTGTHTHTQEFYELYHDSAHTSLSWFVQYCLSHVEAVLKNEGKKLTKKAMVSQDQLVRAARAQEKFDAAAGAVG